MKSKYILSALLLATSFVSCDDLLEPAIENNQDVTAIHQNPAMAMGMLGNAYVLLPYPGSPETDLATDDAVSNSSDNSYREMASGAWESDNTPVSRWRNCYHAIQYTNLLLEHNDQVEYAQSPVLRQLYVDQMKGSCLALRAMHHYYLLQAHAGYVNGRLMGIPYHYESEDANTSDFNTARLTYKETIAAINADFDEALKLLPNHFGNVTPSDVPEKYKAIGATDADYNRAFGDNHKGKVDGAIISAIKAQLALMSASPAFAESGVTYDEAAKAFAKVLTDNVNGLAGLDPTGHTWFANTSVLDNLKSSENPAEVLWRTGNNNSHSLESDNFPPSLYGNGHTNPSQNLVDAFPMENGYPITDPKSGYDPSNPYVGRDPRFYSAILYNGSKQGVDSKAIDCTVQSATIDGLNKENERSTRTGYYMRKLLRSEVNLDPQATSDKIHYTPRIRFTELFLGYAEAANEAYGPTGDGGNGMSAYDVIKAIRNRALKLGSDEYLESIKNDKDAMRELIRNERRLEFCFENKRFWDLRRWKVGMTELNETVRGVRITVEQGVTKYTYIDVDTRNFESHQYYGPIPYQEVLKFSALEQNDGWK